MQQVVKSIIRETRNVKWMKDLFDKDLLEIDDSFQRRFVWMKKHQVKLIESIIIGCPIPEIYLWKIETDDINGDTKYSVIDGQQRLRSIWEYISGKYALTPSSLDFPNPNYQGKKFDRLDPETRKQMWDYPIAINFVETEVTRNDIVQMFLRLNSTDKSLNPQELRNAEFNGEFINLAEKISEETFWDEYKIFSKNDIRRMGDIQFISTILMYLRDGFESETSQASINKMYDRYNTDYAESTEDLECIKKMITNIKALSSSNEEIISFLKSKGHLFTFMIVSYHYTKEGGEITREHTKKTQEFIKYYYKCSEAEWNPETLIQQEARNYRNFMTEGIQKKNNRMGRFKIIKKLINLEL